MQRDNPMFEHERWPGTRAGWSRLATVVLMAAAGTSLLIVPVPLHVVLTFLLLGAVGGVFLSADMIAATVIVVAAYIFGFQVAVDRWFPDQSSWWWQPNIIACASALAVYHTVRAVRQRKR